MVAENFNTWTEVDLTGKLTQSVSQAIWTDMTRNEVCYLYKAHTTTAEFAHALEFNLSSIDVNADSDTNFLAYIWVVCQNHGRPDFVEVGPNIHLTVIEKGSSTTQYQLYLSHGEDIVQEWSTDLDVGTDYYITIRKLGPVVTVKIYSDRPHTNLVDVLSINLTGEDEENISFNYVETTASATTGGDVTDQSDGTVTYMNLSASRKEYSDYYLFVGSEGYQDYLDCQRVVRSPLDVMVAKRDYPDWFHQLADDEPNSNTVIYGVCFITGDIIRVNKIDRKTLEILDYADSPSSLPAGNWCIQTSADYIFVGSYDGRLYRWTKSPFAYVDYITLDTGGSDAVLDMVVDYDTNKLYCIGYHDWVGDRVWRVDIPSFAKDGTVNVPTTTFAYTDPKLKPQIYNGFLYYPLALTNSTAGKIARVQLNPFAYSAMLTLDSDDRIPVGMALYGSRLIVACVTPTPWRPRIVKINTSGFVREDAIDCQESDGSWCQDGEIQLGRDKYYFLTYDNIVEIDLATWARTGDLVPIDSEGGYYPLSLVSGYVNFGISGGEIYNPNTGDTTEFEHVLEWEEMIRKPMPEKPVYGRDIPTPEAESHQVLPCVITIAMRMNTSEKEDFWDLYNEHVWLHLYDDGVKVDDVWMEEPRFRWDSSLGCGDRPWICTVTFICKTT